MSDTHSVSAAGLALLLATALAAAFIGQGAGAQEPAGEVGLPASPAEARTELLVEVLDAGDRPLTTAGEVEVLVDGVPRAVSDLGRGAPERIAVFFDLPFLATPDLLEAAALLSERARPLAELAPVEVVVVDGQARRVLPPVADPEAVAQSLAGIGLRYAGRNEIRALRQAFLEELAAAAADPASHSELRREQLLPAVEDRLEDSARETLRLEAEALRAQRERLISWVAAQNPLPLAARPGARPGALILVTTAFDADPSPFYRSALEAVGASRAATRIERPVVLPSMDEVGRVLASYGWLTFPLDAGALEPGPGSAAAADVDSEETPGLPEGLPTQDIDATAGTQRQRPALITPRLPGRRGGREAGRPSFPPTAGSTLSMGSLARATGGEVVTDSVQLRDLLARLGERRRVTFSAEPGDARPIEVRVVGAAGAGGKPPAVRAPAWLATVPPASVAAVRARRLLAGEIEPGEEGDLVLETVFELARADGAAAPPAATLPTPGATGMGAGDGELIVRLEELAPGERPAGPLRATVGVAREGLEPLVFDQPLVARPEDEPGIFRLAIALPAGAETRVALLVEELASGRWGSAFATHLEPDPEGRSLLGGVERDATTALLPASRPIRLLSPEDPFVMGRTELTAVVTEPSVARVDFYLDGERAASRAAAPYRATLDLGSVPASRRIEVVAVGADGAEIGRDSLVLNEGGGSFRVRIVEPRPYAPGREGAEATLVGPVEVEAEVSAPGDARIDRVEFYWNTELVATRFGPPWRQRVIVPADGAQGFVRVLARLTDGATSEDVVFLNGRGSGVQLDVNLVEMYVVVTDRAGRPVSGLTAKDFRVFEEGDPQTVADFRSGEGLPLTVGLVIDSSASMFVKLPSVGRAAADFARTSLTDDDRAFVVGFGGRPQLAQAATSDDARLLQAIERLRADGQTALWESVVYSLVQLQGASGKRALIVYTDGADEDEDFSHRTAALFARRVGVPIYFILTNNEIVRTGGKGLGVRRYLGKVRRLAETAGGQVYLARYDDDLSAIYDEIGNELRSQYLLTYYSRDLPEETWRRVRVEVTDRQLQARTVAGYWR